MLKVWTLELVEKPGSKIPGAWRPFRVIKCFDNGEHLEFAVCKDCRTVYVYCNGSTTSLSCHKCVSTKPSIPSLDRLVEQLVVPSDALENAKDAAARYVTKDMRPFETLSNLIFVLLLLRS